MIRVPVQTPIKIVTDAMTSRRLTTLAWVAVAGTMLIGATAHAFIPPPPVPAAPVPAAPPPPTPAVEAKRHFEQGVALYGDRNYQAALAEFRAARQLSPSPILLYNIGLTQKALFNYLDAIETLEAFFAQSARDPKVTPARRREVQQLVAEMKALLGDVRLAVVPVEATITVDGQKVQILPGAPRLLKLAAGPHTLGASAPGFVNQTVPVTVTAGAAQDVAFTLVAVPTTARIAVTANVANAAIRIDDQDRGPAPVSIELPAGGHQIQATAGGHLVYQGDLMVVAGQDRSFQVTLQPLALVALPDDARQQPLYKKWWFWAGIGAAIGAGVVIAIATSETQAPLMGTLSPGLGSTR
jgi:hypothetical protein